MLRKTLLLASLIIMALVLSCAKRNTAYQDNDILTLLRQIHVVGNPAELSLDGNDLYVALDQGGMSVINLTDYSQRWWTQLYPVSADAQLVNIRRVSVVGEHRFLFLGEYVGADKIRIVDITDPDTLKLTESIAGGTDGLQKIRFDAIPNPTDDNIIEGFFSAGRNFNYTKYNGQLYLGTIFSINSPATVAGFDITDSHIFIAAQQRGLLIYDRDNQQLVGELALYGEALEVKVTGNHAYLACRQGGLNIVNITNPSAPVLVSGFDTTGYATSIDVKDNLAVVSSGSGGVYLFDVSNPANLILKQRITAAGYTNNAIFSGDKVIVAARDQGILIYKIN